MIRQLHCRGMCEGLMRYDGKEENFIKTQFPSSLNRAVLQHRHTEPDGVLNNWGLDCLLNCLFRCRSKKTSKFRVTGLWEGNPLVTGDNAFKDIACQMLAILMKATMCLGYEENSAKSSKECHGKKSLFMNNQSMFPGLFPAKLKILG